MATSSQTRLEKFLLETIPACKKKIQSLSQQRVNWRGRQSAQLLHPE